MPEGWCVDAEGEITTDPKEVIDGGGNLLPLGMDRERGAHKGYSLYAFLIQVFHTLCCA
jgi:LDH2 family malate/lactate/ureidoglycolate dehydrogenase